MWSRNLLENRTTQVSVYSIDKTSLFCYNVKVLKSGGKKTWRE